MSRQPPDKVTPNGNTRGIPLKPDSVVPAAVLSLLDERPQVAGRFAPVLSGGHGLLDGHETSLHDAQSGIRFHERGHLLLQACHCVEPLGKKAVDCAVKGGRSNQLGVPEAVRQMRVEHRVPDDRDAHAVAVEVEHGATRRRLASDIGALEHDKGRGEVQLLGTYAIDGEDGHVPSPCQAGLADADRPLVADQGSSYGQPVGQLVEEIDRQAA